MELLHGINVKKNCEDPLDAGVHLVEQIFKRIKTHFCGRMGTDPWSWGRYGHEYGEFKFPSGVAVWCNRVYVADSHNHRVQCFDTHGVFLFAWGRAAKGRKDSLHIPQALAIGGREQSICLSLRCVDGLSRFPPGVLPMIASYVGDECIYVADNGNHCMKVFTTNGTWIRSWGKRGFQDSEFSNLQSCAVGAVDGLIYTMDGSPNIRMWTADFRGLEPRTRVQVFEPTGRFVKSWNSKDYSPSSLDGFCYGRVATSNDGRIYAIIHDDGNHRVVCFNPDGTVAKGGHWPRSSEIFPGPEDILAAEDGRVFVSDSKTNVIFEFKNGAFVQQLPGKYQGKDLYRPIGMAKGQDNVLYVCDSQNHRIVVFTLGKK